MKTSSSIPSPPSTTQHGPTTSALETQLEQVNERARWYASQMWQLPMTYIAISGAGVATTADKGIPVFVAVLGAISVVGTCVFWQVIRLRGGDKRAVENIIKVEAALNVQPTAKYQAWNSIPLLVLTGLMTVASAVAAWAVWHFKTIGAPLHK